MENPWGTKSGPKLIFGASNLGVSFSTAAETTELLGFLKSQGIRHIDTARRYPGPKPGLSEKLLGDSKAAERGFIVDTNINIPATGPNGSLTRDKILEPIEESCGSLRVKQVNTVYCHTPDSKTPIKESAAVFFEAFKNGRFEKLGLCNYSFDQVAEFLDACRNGFPEGPLIWKLRSNNMLFNAYSPLASGFLTGKLTSGEDVEGTRFDRTNTAGAFHQSWYDKPGMHWAINKLQVVIKPHKLTLAGVSLRWLMYHSMLGEGDGIILGGSKFDQIASNVADIAKGLLEKVVVKALNEMWLSVKIKAP